jgi:hypothetical protein
MNLIDCEDLSRQISYNCNISDAHHAGIYSICGLALRLRDLFKWDKRLPPWVEKDPPDVLSWIGEKEAYWETLEGADYRQIEICNHRFDPFDTPSINNVLIPAGLLYGAGYAYSLKPTFFLGQIEAQNSISGYQVFTLGREWARDLLTIPAFAQDSCVILRQESAMLYLWDKISYIKKSGRPALNFALTQCGIKKVGPQTLPSHLQHIFNLLKDTYIYHEIGELQETVFDRDIWRSIIAAFPHTPIELLARTVKDLLADTHSCGTLSHLLEERQAAALGFYVAFWDGLAREIFPNLRSAFEQFVASGDWSVMAACVDEGYQRAKWYAETMMDLYRTGRQKHDDVWTAEQIKSHLLPNL